MVGKYFSEKQTLAYGIALSGRDVLTCLAALLLPCVLFLSITSHVLYSVTLPVSFVHLQVAVLELSSWLLRSNFL